MTLVLSCATADFVYQVSDRRLTWLDGPNPGGLIDDDTNKAVVVGGRFAFSYTGLATVSGESTDIWLAKTAAAGSTDDLKVLCDRICDRASEAFQSIQAPAHHRRHAFVGIGWETVGKGPGLEPILLTISNAVDSRGEWLPIAGQTFSVQFNNWGRIGAGFGISAAGQPLRSAEKYAIWRLIRRCVKRRAEPNGVMLALVLAMDFVADRYSAVGHNLMTICLPRSAVQRVVKGEDFFAFLGEPTPHDMTFRYMPEDGGMVDFGPHFAMSGRALLGFVRSPVSET